MKSYKKIAGLLGLVATLTLVASCGNKNEKETKEESALPSIEGRYELDESQPAWKLDKKEEPTQLTWYVNADWWNKEFGKDLVTKKIKEDLNIDIKFITGDDTKLNTYFASGDMPDIVTIFDSNSTVAKKADSWALPLETLAEKYDPYFSEVARQDTLNWYKLKDDKAYGYPNYSNTAEDYESGAIFSRDAFVMRKDVYEGIGKPDMTTPEGFIKGMNLIKEKYPDLIPFGFNDFAADGSSNGSMDGVVQDMLGVPQIVDGKYNDRNLDEDYLAWVKAFRQVHQDGNINDDSFTDDGDKFKEKIQTGKYASVMLGSFVNQGIPLQTFASDNPDSEYIAVDGIQSTKGNEATLTQAGISGWMISYISAKAEDPAKAIQLFTYLLSDEGQMLANFGIEGETYTVAADGSVEWTAEAREIQKNDPEKWQLEYRMGEFIPFGHDRFKALNKDSYVDAVKQMQEWGTSKLTTQFATENITPDAGSAESRALGAITTNWSTTLVGMLRAKDEAEFNKLLEGYKAFQKSNDIDAINDIRNEKIKLNEEKLAK